MHHHLLLLGFIIYAILFFTFIPKNNTFSYFTEYFNNNVENKNNDTDIMNNERMIKTIKGLLTQSSRWNLAALNDRNPLIAVLHGNYAAAYLWALLDIATTEEIENVTGVDILKFQEKTKETQRQVTQKASELCPQFRGKSDEFLAAIAGQ